MSATLRIGIPLLALSLAACATAPPPVTDFATRQAVLEEALGEIGRPYRYGGGDADGFDCSGLVHYVFEQAGVELPRTAAEQRRAGRAIDFRDAAPGDLVFYRFGNTLHATIYVGDDRVVHAPASGQTVTVTRVDNDYWRERLVSVVRVLN
ncbi:MAG: C40 family peptidase [Nevskia sp.]|nr:C40 family peptidase [Nevskia sp.]